jgi:endonuclease/exonuclease/phosphatase family metal-dependent hydrolase
MKDLLSFKKAATFGKIVQDLAIISRGASKGLCTLWNPQQYQLEESKATQHWILVKLVSNLNCKNFIVINIYMPNQYHEKQDCWHSLLDFSEEESLDNFIFAGDFNTTIHHWEKRGAPLFDDPC